jgi:hypothetical protein
LNLGHVYVVYTTLARPPKDKITICVCAVNGFFLWINTEPRQHGIGQFPLARADHACLTHDCFLDCSRVIVHSEAEIAAAAQRGPISKDLATRIVAYLTKSPPKTFAPRHLRLVIEQLSAFIAALV